MPRRMFSRAPAIRGSRIVPSGSVVVGPAGYRSGGHRTSKGRSHRSRALRWTRPRRCRTTMRPEHYRNSKGGWRHQRFDVDKDQVDRHRDGVLPFRCNPRRMTTRHNHAITPL